MQRNSMVLFAAVCLLLGFAALPLDLMVAKFFLQDAIPGDIRALFSKAEVFGHAYGVIAICITIWLLDRPNRKHVPTLIGISFAAGLLADVLKLFVWRIRPRDFEPLLSSTETASLWDTFQGSLFTAEQIDLIQLIDSSHHSLPSAHTAVTVTFAILLGRVYPQGKQWFGCLALLCALNRVDGGAHFLSDVFWGSAIGGMTIYVIPELVRIRSSLQWRSRKPLSKCQLSSAA